MGYTHYFYRPVTLDAAKFKAAVEDFKKLLPNIGDRKIGLAGWNGKGEPEITEDRIRFNGMERNGHETFHIPVVYGERDLHPEDPLKFSFCKTAQKPYDLGVTACLVIFKHHFGKDFKVSSDGDLGDWKSAIDLVGEVLGYTEAWEFSENGLEVV